MTETAVAAMPEKYFPTLYQEFIHLSRYARWIEDLGRRETWPETVARYVDFMFDKQISGKLPEYKEEVRNAILALEIMPSMRCMMTAGPALEKDNAAAYNCSFVAIDNPVAFDEMLYILMCGTGVGFSVERQFIDKMPVIADKLRESKSIVAVEDSKIGWANALRELISMLYQGRIPSFDVSGVRPSGARLKTFGGRASGPGPLIDLFKFIIHLFKQAAGRKLNSIECHDIACKIGEIVVVGGVRRCLPGETPVFTPKGPKAIKDIRPGDVIVSGGEFGKVVAAGPSGKKDTVTIHHRFGKLECTPEHRVAVFNSIMKYEFKMASDIVEGDRLVWDSVGYEGGKTELPILEEDIHFNSKTPTVPALTTDVAWFLGLFHGDGCVEEKGIEISGNMHDIAILERAAGICESAFGVDATFGHDGREGGVGARLRSNSVVLSRWFGKNIKRSHETIHIPDSIWNASREIRFAYLSGLLDADGRVRKDGAIDQACTVYRDYAEKLVTLLAGLGIAAVISDGNAEKRRKKGVKAQDFNNVRIVGNTNRRTFYKGCLPFSYKFSRRTPNFSGYTDFSFPIRWGGTNQGYKTNGNILVSSMRYDLPLLPSRVVAVEKGRSVDTYDIQVEGLERFTANGLVVHNSALISLSNPSDERMRYAKNGEWWKDNPQRAMANNSACYTEKPECDRFMREWLALMDSKSGERGIFNRTAAKKNIERYGRRDPNHEFGSNPCVSSITWVMTADGPRQVHELIDTPFVSVVDSVASECHTGFFQTGVKDTFDVETDRGYSLSGITADHPVKVEVSRRTVYSRVDGRKLKAGYDRKFEWRKVSDLKSGDKLVLSRNEYVSWGEEDEEELGWLVGQIVGNGGHNPEKYPTYLRFWEEHAAKMAEHAVDIVKRRLSPSVQFKGAQFNAINKTWQVACVALGDLCDGLIEKRTKNILPALEKKSSSFQCGFIRGFFDADGSPQGNVAKGRSVRLSQAGTEKLKVVQRIMARLGIATTITDVRCEGGPTMLPDGRGGEKEYVAKDRYELIVARNCIDIFADRIGFSHPDKKHRLETLCDSIFRAAYEDTYTAKVTKIVSAGVEAVYDCQVDDMHCFDANGIVIHNCSEIVLRSCGFCNLSEVIIRPTDTPDDLKRKVRLATIVGTVQSTMTNFRYLRPIWKDNAEEERLLGVSMTGIMDNTLTSGKEGRKKLADTLDELRAYAVAVNKEFATKLGIQKSTAITCVKPSGTVSQLVDCASGIHPRFSHYYIRTVRADSKDPLAKLMRDIGFPCEPDVTKPEHNLVFSFPVKSSSNSVVVDDVSAIDQLELWKVYQRNWTEHKPSITVYVKDNEWFDVGAWVFKNFDEISGIAFLPYSGHTYKQAPYQEISEEEYTVALAKMPKDVDWSLLKAYEVDDSAIIGYKELACSGGKCEEVDVTKSEPPTLLEDGSGTKQ